MEFVTTTWKITFVLALRNLQDKTAKVSLRQIITYICFIT